MYRKAIACIEQSVHEQLFERDCRCMRVTEKPVHTPKPTFLCYYCASVCYLVNKQDVIMYRVEKGNGLATCYLL